MTDVILFFFLVKEKLLIGSKKTKVNPSCIEIMCVLSRKVFLNRDELNPT